MALLYFILSLGALTTIYPFAVMMVTGFKGPTDQNDNSLKPRFWSEFASIDAKTKKLAPESLMGKYLFDKYAGDASMIDSTRIGDDVTKEDIEHYEKFLMSLPVDWWAAGFRTAPSQSTGRLTMLYQAWLRTRYKIVDELNRAYIEENAAFQTVQPPAEMLERKSWQAPTHRKYKEWLEFKATLPAEFRLPIRAERLYQEFLRGKYQNQFDQVPANEGRDALKFEEIKWFPSGQFGMSNAEILKEEIEDALSRDGWDFRIVLKGAKEEVPLSKVAQTLTREELISLTEEIRLYQGQNTSRISLNMPLPEVEFFNSLPPRYQKGKTVELLFRDSQIDSGREYQWRMPIADYETAFVKTNESQIKQELSTRNYSYVLDYVALNGRALWNTAIFCLLAIGIQLTVNPLAAYALSRFPMKATGKILLFLLATMAFPAEVAMIPSFLLLKDLGLLNTFAALVLPTAASGYMIFLLKGFFDSLPPELFESGQIDGAKETTMMMRIALPLSRPVLGYMALIAFMGAYGAFLYAFLVAQDQKIWTLMVFIYQLQNTAPKSVMMAALTLAALPTLLVFLFAQRVIMRGIILPGEK